MTPTHTHAIGFAKGKEKYIFLYDDKSRADMLIKFGQFAAHPELSFNWFDAAALSQKLRAEERTEATR